MVFSKLANAVGRKADQYRPGQLVMVWRQRVRPGKIKGAWTGPLRLVLMEGSTAWLVSGSTLIRAKVNQIRPTSQRETLDAALEGTAIYRVPVSLESLMRNFRGRYYMDISGDVPSEELQRGDLSASTPLVEPAREARKDSWSVKWHEGKKYLIRHHELPRLALFSPSRVAQCPVSLEELQGARKTIVRPLHGGDEVTLHDTVDETRTLQDRWKGETWFELVNIAPAKKARVRREKGEKRKAEGEEPDDRPDEPREQEDDPPESGGPSSSSTTALQKALREKGPEMVDSLPVRGESGANRCPVPECDLHGGHPGHHQDWDGRTFMYDLYEGRRAPTGAEVPIEDTSSSSTSSISEPEDMTSGEEELMVMKENEKPPASRPRKKPPEPEDTFLAFNLEVSEEDFNWLAKNKDRRRGAIWLSKKMSEKGKEIQWEKLPLSEKKEFDMAMAKELSQVAISKALRNLTKKEELQVRPEQLMKMRWVLTRKSDGTAKARLVVLGFMAHNLTEVATTSPTMSKVGRNVILTLAAAYKFKLKAGDVTSAFLQTGISLEDEELNVLAPPELSAMFGSEAGDQRVLRVREAFYGLAHAPRKWWERCVQTMKDGQWHQLLGDKCCFALYEPETGGNGQPPKLVGLAGLHVDDFLLAGDETSQFFVTREKMLNEAFRWGRWNTRDFEFAGSTIKQNDDGSIILNQESYTLRWIEEIEVDKSKAMKTPLTPAEISSMRAALGTISWRSTQSAPQFLAETSLLLSEVNKGTIESLHKVNKLVREMRREAGQGLIFPTGWQFKGITDLCAITWADASQHNRPDKSSTVGIITGITVKEALGGAETQVAVVQWKSGKTPRQCLGSNGAEVQSITIGEDQNYQIRAMMAEFGGLEMKRAELHSTVRRVPGALVMDSRGIYDAMTRNLSALHGLRDSRAGYELTLAVNQALKAGTELRWVNGLAQLGDSLTKSGARKTILQFLSQRQHWRLTHDDKFEAGRKVHKKIMEQRLREAQNLFVEKLRGLAEKFNWPWDADQPVPEYPPFT